MVSATLRPDVSVAVIRRDAAPDAWLPTWTAHRVPTPAGESAREVAQPDTDAARQVVPPSQEISTRGRVTGTAVTPAGIDRTSPNENGPAGARFSSSSIIGRPTCMSGRTWWSPFGVADENPQTV